MGKFLAGICFGVFLLAVFGIAALRSGFMPVDALSSPPRWEEKIAGMSLDASVEKRAGSMKNPVPSSDENLLAGLKLYEENCSVCHGGWEKRSAIGFHSLYPRAPQFGERKPRAPASKSPGSKSSRDENENRDAETFWIIKHGIRYTAMPGWDKILKDEKIWNIVAFLSRAGNLPPKVRARWEADTRQKP